MLTVRIEGSLRANLIAALAGARRWRGRPVHKDTLDHWNRLVAYSRETAQEPEDEPVSYLLTALEAELANSKVISTAGDALNN